MGARAGRAFNSHTRVIELRPTDRDRRAAICARQGAKLVCPMIVILIIAHDTLPESLVKAVTHVLGTRPAQFEMLSVTIADDPFDLLPTARERVRQLDTGDGVIIFSDIYGATPCNLAGKLLVPGRVEVVAGVNLPMLVR